MKKYFVSTLEDVTITGEEGYGTASAPIYISSFADDTYVEMTAEESFEWYKENADNIILVPMGSIGPIIRREATSTGITGLIYLVDINNDAESVNDFVAFFNGDGTLYNARIDANTLCATLYLLDSSSKSDNERTEDMSLNTITPLTEYAFKVASVEKTAVDASHNAIVITLAYQNPASLTLAEQSYEFVQTEDLTEKGIAVQPYGAILLNELAPTQNGYGSTVLALKTPGGLLETESDIEDLLTVGATVTFAASEPEGE